jgi:hypothetical protein
MKDIGDMSSRLPYISDYTFLSNGTDISDKILCDVLKNNYMTLNFINLITMIMTIEIIVQ